MGHSLLGFSKSRESLRTCSLSRPSHLLCNDCHSNVTLCLENSVIGMPNGMACFRYHTTNAYRVSSFRMSRKRREENTRANKCRLKSVIKWNEKPWRLIFHHLILSAVESTSSRYIGFALLDDSSQQKDTFDRGNIFVWKFYCFGTVCFPPPEVILCLSITGTQRPTTDMLSLFLK